MQIGLFDSGLGGLTILRAVAKHLPAYDYRYYGDTKNLPYGDKTEEEIYELTKQGVRHLFDAGCLLVIIACNTASAATVRQLQDQFLPEEYPDRKLLGIIVPTVEVMLGAGKGTALLLGTRRTVDSAKYATELAKTDGQTIRLCSVATPELVPLIEEGAVAAAAKLAIEVIETHDTVSEVVVLGCSHYTEIASRLRAHFQGSKEIISQDEVVPAKLTAYLAVHPEIRDRLSNQGTRNVYLTEHKPRYDTIISQLLGGAGMNS